ncbi:MAG: hypothetical protein O3A00_08055 [Planctomycetota bacterium]|nr:hypothetical protein [Planctomycetota bacterium]
MIEHIFLDMDGVIVDFVTSALQVHAAESAIEDWPPGVWNIHEVLGITRNAFWSKLDDVGATLWRNLDPYPWFEELVSLLREFATVTILSSPSRNPESASGKLHWLDQHLGRGQPYREFLLSQRKYLLAAPGRVLVDDSDAHAREFCEHGGQAIVFPQLWNANHPITDRLGYVRSELIRLSTPSQG